jgi:3-oxoacyl-[acyl-carrier protein] reductase
MMRQTGLDGRAHYCAAKPGVDNLTRTLAVEWAEHRIHVNALAPGYVCTAITDQSMESVGYTTEEVHNRTPLGRFGTPEEMAECALFLASRENFVPGKSSRPTAGGRRSPGGVGDGERDRVVSVIERREARSERRA